MSNWNTLNVKDVRRETPDTVSVAFEIPESLKSDYHFIAGQYLTLSFNLNGTEERRAYSICSAPHENELRVAIKEVENGKVSSHVNQNLKAGDQVKVMTPEGAFTFSPNEDRAKTFAAFAAGSGITPILSIAKSIADKEPNSKFILFYGNKDEQNTIFKSALDNMPSNVEVVYIYTRQEVEDHLCNGRINEQKATALVEKYGIKNAEGVYLCGPEQMIVNGIAALEKSGLSKEKIHYELFTDPVLMEGNATAAADVNENFNGEATITVVYDDEEFEFNLNRDGESILETAIEEGVDVPFSCKGAVCCTCKAKVTEGSAVMDANYALTDQEVADGFILTCTSHPTSSKVVVNYDEI